MIRLGLCIVLLGGTVAFLSCDSDDKDGGGATAGHGGGGGTGGSTGCPPGYACDGAAPVAGHGGTGGVITSGADGGGPVGGSGGGGRGGIGGVGARGGSIGGDGTGPVAGRGGTGGRGGAGGALQPCDGLGYFTQRGLCAATYVQQAARNVPGNCDYVRVFTGSCGGQQVWTTRYQGLGDPVTCGYDSAGNLAGARTCTDTPVPQWNCDGAASSPNCLNAGTLPDVNACTLTTTCDASGGRGGAGGGGRGGNTGT